jgi:TRAP transporter 4TM/12TM fusion protein
MTDQTMSASGSGRSLASIVVNVLTGLLTVICLAWVLDVPRYLGYAFYREQLLAPVLGLAIAAMFLSVPAGKTRGARPPWYDWVLAALGLGAMLWITAQYSRLLIDLAFRTPEVVALGAVILVLVLEGLRRTTGYALLAVVLLFLAYAMVGHLVPGQFRARPVDFDWMLVYLSFDPSALFGSPMTVGATVVVIFIWMGQLLFKAGGGQFFTDIAMALMGRQRGGPAKIAVVASALFGSISGSAVSNVASTGIITIPMMKRSGYSGRDAGAIEAVASTGGQLMPPIMGAAAFLMAEFLEVPYRTIMLAALVPAFLYYLAVFIQVDLVAAREKIDMVEQELPRPRDVLKKGWHFLVPFVVLLYALFQWNEEAEIAAIYACLSIIVLGMIFSYKGARLHPKDILGSFSATGNVMIELFMILGGAGFVIGVLNLTGLGFTLTLVLVQVGAGNLYVLLVVAALVCIVLGMGMPTSGVYILLATLVAPAIVKAGADPLAAHMFILYFGMMSMITPPIALASFAASTISGASPMATGFQAMRLGWVAYIIPFMFVLSPTLLMKGDPVHIVLNILTASFGVYLISVAFADYFVRRLRWPVQLLMMLAGLMTIFPDSAIGVGGLIDAAGAVLGLLLLAYEYRSARRTVQAAG